MMFEWTLSIGTILTLVTIVGTAASFYWKGVYASEQFKHDITDIKLDLKQLNKVIMDLALQTQRLDILEKMVYDIRHGRGFVEE